MAVTQSTCNTCNSGYLKLFLTTHEAAWYIISVVSLSLSVCLFVCLSDDNFRKPWRRNLIFAHPVYLQGTRVKFVYEGHRVKVKVTGATKVNNLIYLFTYLLNLFCRNENNSIVNNSLVLQNIQPRSMSATWGFWLWRIEWCNRHLWHVTGSDRAYLNVRIRRLVGLTLEVNLVVISVSL